MYNSDTVYSTTTFRPVSPSPITPPLNTPSPQRTRKLETPLHLDGGLFSDIRSTDGKLLSKVTVDRVQRSTRHDITDSPNATFDNHPKGNSNIDDIVKTETITNEDVITVKFTPVLQELDSPRLLTPSQMYQIRQKSPAPIEYINNDFEDLQSYKIVNSLCKNKLFETEKLLPELQLEGTLINRLDNFEPVNEVTSLEDVFLNKTNVSEPLKRACSPLANELISEQLSKIDSYLQESLEFCSGTMVRSTPSPVTTDIMMGCNTNEKANTFMNQKIYEENITHSTISSQFKYEEDQISKEDIVTEKPVKNEELTSQKGYQHEPELKMPSYDIDNNIKSMSKINSVSKKQPGVLSAIYNMPIHYQAAILCFFLIIYNLIYQYIKQNCNGNKK